MNRSRARDPRTSGLAAAVAGLGVGVAGYWRLMSPYSQAWGHFPYRGATSEPAVALTFDDGPNEPYSSRIATLLEDRGARGTFFQVGQAVRRHPEVTDSLARSGHVIGHHGDSHRLRTSLSRAALLEDIRKGQQAFAAVGLRPALYRPPWLLRIPALRAVLFEEGLRPVSGEFCHVLEVAQPGAQRIARRALAKIRPGSIVIFHDGFDGKVAERGRTVEAVEIVVDRVCALGWSLVTIDRLLGVPAYQSTLPA